MHSILLALQSELAQAAAPTYHGSYLKQIVMGVAKGFEVGDHKYVDDQNNLAQHCLQGAQRLDLDEDWYCGNGKLPHHICHLPVGKSVASVQEAEPLDD